MIIHIFLPKRRINPCNSKRWKSNHHKKPQYLVSEMNKAIRENADGDVLQVLWREKFKMKYRFGVKR